MRAPKNSTLRARRASLLRSRSQLLGVVYAPDEKSAEAAAVAEFKIGDEQQQRLVVREQGLEDICRGPSWSG